MINPLLKDREIGYNQRMKKYRNALSFLLLSSFLFACAPQATPDPDYIYTAVAGTQKAAVFQTERARSFYTMTPTQATLRPTLTLEATPTIYIFTPDTLTPSPTVTRTPTLVTTWPEWKTGEVTTMPPGTGQNIGTNKYFRVLDGLQVIVVRENGVGLRSAPNKAVSGPKEEKGSAFTLTGVMNKNPQYGWLFVQVIAADGRSYWVGGDIGDKDIDPTVALDFYYPDLTPSPTPLGTLTPTP